MTLSPIELMEIIFNLSYLGVIYYIVYKMWDNEPFVRQENRVVAIWFYRAFFLLALGDTGHVGFRVVAYMLGGLEENAFLVGMGALSTAITVGIFYLIFIEIWRIRFRKPFSWLYYLLMTLGLLRYLVFGFPQNDWGNLVPPLSWSLARNIPLMIQGLVIAYLFFIEGKREEDRLFQQLSIWILVSFAFYIPVILFVRELPLIGMLMVPKTIAYVIMAWIVYVTYFEGNSDKPKEDKPTPLPTKMPA